MLVNRWWCEREHGGERKMMEVVLEREKYNVERL
jgi:hypothetical protein